MISLITHYINSTQYSEKQLDKPRETTLQLLHSPLDLMSYCPIFKQCLSS